MQINTNINKQQTKAPAFGAINAVEMCHIMEKNAPGSVKKFCYNLKVAAGDAFFHGESREVHLKASNELAQMRHRAAQLKHLGLPENLMEDISSGIHGIVERFNQQGAKTAKNHNLDIKPPVEDIQPIKVSQHRTFLGEEEHDMWHNMGQMDTVTASLGEALHDKMIGVLGEGIRVHSELINPKQKVFVTKHAGSGQEWDYTGQHYGGAPIRTAPWGILRGWGHPLEDIKGVREDVRSTKNNPEHVALCETIEKLNGFQKEVPAIKRNAINGIEKVRANFEQTIINRKNEIAAEKLAKQLTASIDDVFKA